MLIPTWLIATRSARPRRYEPSIQVPLEHQLGYYKTRRIGAVLAHSLYRNFILEIAMRAGRWASSVLFAIAAISTNAATAQTSAGSGTVVVIPTTANLSVYATEIFVRNQNQ